MLTRSELTKARAKDLLEKIQSNMFAGINCGWRREMGLNEGHCFGGHLSPFPLSFWVIIWKCPMIVAKELNPVHRTISILLIEFCLCRGERGLWLKQTLTILIGAKRSKLIHRSRAMVKGFFGYDNLFPALSFWVFCSEWKSHICFLMV